MYHNYTKGEKITEPTDYYDEIIDYYLDCNNWDMHAYYLTEFTGYVDAFGRLIDEGYWFSVTYN